jgi:hypothetical protein
MNKFYIYFSIGNKYFEKVIEAIDKASAKHQIKMYVYNNKITEGYNIVNCIEYDEKNYSDEELEEMKQEGVFEELN